jgi:hypothetical protein
MNFRSAIGKTYKLLANGIPGPVRLVVYQACTIHDCLTQLSEFQNKNQMNSNQDQETILHFVNEVLF